MSKINYDDALKILNDYRNQNYNSTFRDEVELASAIDVILPKYVKQEKLLELYKEKSEILSQLRTVSQLPMADNLRLIEIENEIKENEK